MKKYKYLPLQKTKETRRRDNTSLKNDALPIILLLFIKKSTSYAFREQI